MSYNEFLNRQSKSFLDEALGKKDADSFKSGDLKITKFKERANAPMELEDLISSHELSLNNPED